MVLCKFFQQGSCRFGSKCNNEHLDVKQLIKTDVEAAINGNQWPMSCFGPFKDRPCIPNFIEDQSFEEIRFLCYESKKNNFFEQFHQQFSKEALEAKNKLKALLQLTPEVVAVVASVHDASGDVAAGVASTTNNANNSNNPFGAMASVFGSNTTATTPVASNNVFGGNTFGQSAAGVGGGIFGGAVNAFNNVPNQQQQQQSSIFAQTAKPANSIFGGGGAPQQQTTGNSVFGQTQNAAAIGGSIFAKPQPTLGAAGSGLFAQAAQQPMSGNLFTQQSAQQTTWGTAAGGAGIFAQGAQQQPTNVNPFIAQQQQTQAAATGGGLFGNVAQQTQHIFAQQQQQQTQANTGGFFQPSQQQQSFMHQQQPPAANVSAAASHSTIYSRMEDLSADDIEAFKADFFTMGKIPFSPPAREQVN